jgi:O-antigen ligase
MHGLNSGPLAIAVRSRRARIAFIAVTFLVLSTPDVLNHLKLLPELGVLVVIAGHLFAPIRRIMVTTRIPILLGLLVAWMISTIFWSDGHTLSLLETTATLLVVILASLVGTHASRNEVLFGLIFGGLGALGLSLVVAAVSPGTGLMPAGYEGGTLRGIYDHRNVLSAVLTAPTIATLAVEVSRPRAVVKRLALFAPLFGGILLTQSSTALSAVVVAVFFAGILAIVRRTDKRIRVTTAVAILALLGVVALALAADPAIIYQLLHRNDTLTGRKIIWQAVGNLIAEHPWIGHGWGATWDVGVPARAYVERFVKFAVPSAHNGYLDILLQLGIVGLVLFCAILFVVLARGLGRTIRGGTILDSWGPILVASVVIYDYGEAFLVTTVMVFVVSMALVQSSARASVLDDFRVSRISAPHATAAATL